MELSRLDESPGSVQGDRRSGDDRRGGPRRNADRAERMRDMAAFAIAMCGGLAVLYLFFVAIGTVDIGDAMVATIGATVLALIWLIGFWWRMRTNAAVAQRPDRERRGF